MRLGVTQRLYLLVDCDRDNLGHAGNIAADHQDDAELAHRVGEPQHRGGQDPGTRERYGDPEETVERPRAKRRSRSVARPRQVAMSLSKELTNHSLPEIGDSFGGRDHTTVLHACRKIKELRETNSDIREDYKNLLRSLTT